MRLLEELGPKGLRELAVALEEQSPERRGRASLTPQARDELVALLAAGKVPTVGFWRRRLPRRIQCESSRGPMATRQLVRIVAGMVGDGLPEVATIEACVALAVETGLRQPIAERAAARGVVMGRQHRDRRG